MKKKISRKRTKRARPTRQKSRTTRHKRLTRQKAQRSKKRTNMKKKHGKRSYKKYNRERIIQEGGADQGFLSRRVRGGVDVGGVVQAAMQQQQQKSPEEIIKDAVEDMAEYNWCGEDFMQEIIDKILYLKDKGIMTIVSTTPPKIDFIEKDGLDQALTEAKQPLTPGNLHDIYLKMKELESRTDYENESAHPRFGATATSREDWSKAKARGVKHKALITELERRKR